MSEGIYASIVVVAEESEFLWICCRERLWLASPVLVSAVGHCHGSGRDRVSPTSAAPPDAAASASVVAAKPHVSSALSNPPFVRVIMG